VYFKTLHVRSIALQSVSTKCFKGANVTLRSSDEFNTDKNQRKHKKMSSARNIKYHNNSKNSL